MLNFTVESETEEETKKFILGHRAELASVPRERYGKEFLKGFARCPHDFLTMLENYSLLPTALPEIEAMRGVEQPAAFHPEGDVLAHTFHVLAEAQKTIENRRGNDVVFAFAALFHDVGKPQTVRPHPKYGYDCFFGHDEVGERITMDTLGAWAIPGGITSRAAALVRHHMIPGGDFVERTCVKLIRKLGYTDADGVPLTDRLFDLALCDARGSMGTGKNILAARRLFCEVQDNLLRAKEASSKRWLDGNDVMKILGIPPSREIGRILEELDVAVGAGKLRCKDEAAEWLKNGRPAL
jgi:poly(A) polymerase